MKMVCLSEKFQDNYHTYICIDSKIANLNFLLKKRLKNNKICVSTLIIFQIYFVIVKSKFLSLNSRNRVFYTQTIDKLSFITFVRRRLLYLFKINMVNRICEKALYKFW